MIYILKINCKVLWRLQDLKKEHWPPYLLRTSASGNRLVPCRVDTHDDDGFLKGSRSASGSKVVIIIVIVAPEISVDTRGTCVQDVVAHEVRHATMILWLQTGTASPNTWRIQFSGYDIATREWTVTYRRKIKLIVLIQYNTILYTALLRGSQKTYILACPYIPT